MAKLASILLGKVSLEGARAFSVQQCWMGSGVLFTTA